MDKTDNKPSVHKQWCSVNYSFCHTVTEQWWQTQITIRFHF